MPRSRIRRRPDFTPPPTRSPAKVGSSRWLAPTMVACFLIGLVWLIVYYVTSTAYPIPGIGPWNLGIGFVWIMAGFGLATRWT